MRACKHCAAPLRVVDTRPATIEPNEGESFTRFRLTHTIWRRRECPNGHRFDTVEVPVGPRLKYRVRPQWPKGGAK